MHERGVHGGAHLLRARVDDRPHRPMPVASARARRKSMADRISRDPRDKGDGGGCGCGLAIFEVRRGGQWSQDGKVDTRRFSCPTCGAKLNPYDVALWAMSLLEETLDELDPEAAFKRKSWEWFERIKPAREELFATRMKTLPGEH